MIILWRRILPLGQKGGDFTFHGAEKWPLMEFVGEGRKAFVCEISDFIRYAVVHLSPHLFPHFERRKNTAIFPPGNVSRKNSRTTYINARAIKIFGVSALIRAGKRWLCEEQKMLQIPVVWRR